ncbi:hypothetical protein COT49_00320 [candidate division WWE3 bacterium CG08_land_8_20_14_0_20_40_13]|uniref:AbiEi antitoxin C-terminal domain-containing protein n=1 Tax=candidate division WWE3 bacterium CG08_land_8_20_14_0_20_40_13 TaxID=1975084 RepID=A0A2H0XET8_UNCKA|nr:MAG: hypothetical protein COT49_00320 [candidate division WWE3 bacterium CG08_land_8_20_14_0_20_40_13]
MESLPIIKIYQKIKDLNLKFVDYLTLAQVTGYSNKNTLYKIAGRLVKAGILKNLMGGKFVLGEFKAESFEIANYLYQPSYISLESALSFYGILPQFSYTISSITTKKTKKISVDGKEFSFSSISPSLFWSYKKEKNFLIASPEKALLDSLYFSLKKIINLDKDELDITCINRKELLRMSKLFNNNQLILKATEVLE